MKSSVGKRFKKQGIDGSAWSPRSYRIQIIWLRNLTFSTIFGLFWGLLYASVTHIGFKRCSKKKIKHSVSDKFLLCKLHQFSFLLTSNFFVKKCGQTFLQLYKRGDPLKIRSNIQPAKQLHEGMGSTIKIETVFVGKHNFRVLFIK